MRTPEVTNGFKLAEELEAEGDGLDSELDGIVDEVLSEEF